MFPRSINELAVVSKKNSNTGVQTVTVDSNRDGQRLDNFLANHLKGVPRSAIYRMVRTGQVRVNGKRCKAANRLAEGDLVRIPPARVRSSGEVVISEKVSHQVECAILFENDEFLVVDKPSGMAVHAGSGLPWGLIDVLRHRRRGEYLELVHRLDRETSGCLVLAKSGAGLNWLSAQFREGRVEKRYLCLMDGVLPEASIEVSAPLLKDPSGVVQVSEKGKAARTRFRLLQAFRDASYVEAELFTGRTHQIRAHAKHLGMPLAGDERYASRESVRKWKKRGLKRAFLHAHRLGMSSPDGISRSFEAPLPANLRKILDGLEV